MYKKRYKKGDDFMDMATKRLTNERYCTVRESLEESCKEMNLIREGKLPKKTWQELKKEIKEMKKSNNI